MAFCLIADKLSELNDRLIQNPHVASIEVPLPDEPQRRVFVQNFVDTHDKEEAKSDQEGNLSVDMIARMSSGLNLVNLNVLLSRTRDESRTPRT